jgi:hypothetical protein
MLRKAILLALAAVMLAMPLGCANNQQPAATQAPVATEAPATATEAPAAATEAPTEAPVEEPFGFSERVHITVPVYDRSKEGYEYDIVSSVAIYNLAAPFLSHIPIMF